MDSLYLLLPMSVLFVLALIALFAWALNAGQFEDLEREGLRVLEEPDVGPAVVPTPPVATPEDTSRTLDNAQADANRPNRE